MPICVKHAKSRISESDESVSDLRLSCAEVPLLTSPRSRWYGRKMSVLVVLVDDLWSRNWFPCSSYTHPSDHSQCRAWGTGEKGEPRCCCCTRKVYSSEKESNVNHQSLQFLAYRTAALGAFFVHRKTPFEQWLCVELAFWPSKKAKFVNEINCSLDLSGMNLFRLCFWFLIEQRTVSQIELRRTKARYKSLELSSYWNLSDNMVQLGPLTPKRTTGSCFNKCINSTAKHARLLCKNTCLEPLSKAVLLLQKTVGVV